MKKSARSRIVMLTVLVVMVCTFPTVALSASNFKWPATLSIATTGVGSSSYAILAAWTPVLEQKTGMKIRLRPDNNQALIQRWLRNGEVDLLFTSSSEATMGTFEVQSMYAARDAGPFPMRVAWLGHVQPFGFIARKDSPIKTVYDIKPGQKMAYWTAALGVTSSMDGILAWAKVDKKDVTIVPFASWASSIKSVTEGKADLTFFSPTAPAAFEAEADPSGIRVIELPYDTDRAGAERYVSHRTTAVFGKNTDGIKSAIGVKMVLTPMFIYARESLSNEFVYQFAKWLNENYAAYKDKHPNCKDLRIETFRDILDVAWLPVHEGTIRYLKEVKKWTAKDDTRQKFNLNVAAQHEKGYKAAIATADAKKIEVKPGNKEWEAIWQGIRKDLTPMKVRFDIPTK
jgi:TRAP transporter TAXI family solute receptor